MHLEPSHAGYSLSAFGDANGDGYADLVYGAPYYSSGHTEEGRIQVQFGGQSGGIGSSAKDTVHSSDETNADFGASVTQVGDVNGDGFDDIAVGAPGVDGGGTDRGAVYVFYGDATGIEDTPGTTLTSAVNGAEFGASVGGGWDVDGDGYGDLVIGAPG